MSNRKSFISSAYDAMVSARSRQASAYVNGALLMLDDKTLKSHGYNREELQRKASAFYPF